MPFIHNLTPEKADEIIATHTEEFISDQFCTNPLVSVIVSTYQHGAFIKQCMDGILRQETSFPFEIIVGDDGSTDGAFEILLEYHYRYPEKVRLLHSNQNMGRYTNSGLLNGLRIRRAARGKYITYIEGDDYWTVSDKLQRQVDILEADASLSACFHDVDIKGEYWRGEQIFVNYGNKSLITFEDQLTFDTPMAIHSVVWRAITLPPSEPWMLNTPYGDRLLFARLSNAGPMARIPEIMGTYRKHAGGITVTHHLKSYEAAARVFRMFVNQRKYFHPRGREYRNYMLRFTARQMLRKCRKPNLSVMKLFKTCALILRHLSPLDWVLLVREHFGYPSPYESMHVERRRVKAHA